MATKPSIANRAHVVEEIAKLTGMSKAQASEYFEATLKAIPSVLKKHKEIRLVGFGTYKVTHRKATTGRNPKTGEPLKIAATNLVKFSAGKNLKETVNK